MDVRQRVLPKGRGGRTKLVSRRAERISASLLPSPFLVGAGVAGE